MDREISSSFHRDDCTKESKLYPFHVFHFQMDRRISSSFV